MGARPTRYERGSAEFDRVLGFTDGVIAIALTLLVLGIDLPAPSGNPADVDVVALLRGLSGQFWAFVLSFVIIAKSWVGHHRFLAGLGAVDSPLIIENFVYLFAVVLIPVQSQLIGDYGRNPQAVAISLVFYALLFLILVVFPLQWTWRAVAAPTPAPRIPRSTPEGAS